MQNNHNNFLHSTPSQLQTKLYTGSFRIIIMDIIGITDSKAVIHELIQQWKNNT